MRDTAFIANRLPWRWTIVFGVALFSIFYWGVPALITWHLASVRDPILRSALETFFGRRGHRAEYIAIALLLICLFFATWNAWTTYRMRAPGEGNVGLISRLLARWID